MRSCLVLCLLTSSASAWTMTGSSVSGFGGSVLLSRDNAAAVAVNGNVHAGASTGLVMKKGKSKVPQQMRATYEKQKDMASQRKQMEAASRPGEDGFPVFNLFVRTKNKNVSNVCWRYLYLYLIVEKIQLANFFFSLYSVKAKKAPFIFLSHARLLSR
jgi:hypothetical protein